MRAVVDRSRPTVNKNAIVVGGYRLLKVDTLDNRSISDQILDDIARGGAAGAGRRGGVHRLPPRHLQPAHHPGAGPGAARRLLPRRRQPGREPLGQHHRVPGLRPDHAQRARGALRARRPGFRHPPARLRSLRRGALQAADPQARRARRARLLQRRTTSRSTASSSSTASSTGWSMPSAPATRCSPMPRSPCSPTATPAIATILGTMAAACECECDGNIPVTPDDVRVEDRRRRAADGAALSVRPMRVVVAGLGVQGHKRRRIAGDDFVAAVDPVNPEARYRSIADVPLADYDAVLACIPDEPKIELLQLLPRATASTCWSKSRCGRSTTARSRARGAGAPQRRRLLHRLQSPLRAALRAHARPDRVGRARHDLFLPHVLRQRHGAAGARFRLARSGRRRAARSRLASARYLPVLVRRHRRRVRGRRARTASRTARPTTSSSHASTRGRASSWR